MINFIFRQIGRIRDKIEVIRLERWWDSLRAMGMQLGKGVNLPFNTWIDIPHCFLISIGDNCGFGDACAILAHDAMPNEYIDASRIGRVKIHHSCHFGMRAMIMPGVEIGPRSIIGSGSVVISDIPPETVAAGNPAKVICTLEEYLEKQRQLMKTVPNFQYKEFSMQYLTPEKMQEMVKILDQTVGFMVGGYTAMQEDGECLYRTK